MTKTNKKNRLSLSYIKKNYGWLILFLFIIWMLFRDQNSYLSQRSLNKEIEKLEQAKEFYKEQIKINRADIDKLSKQDYTKKYAREKFNYKKENEDLYIIDKSQVE